MCNTEIQVKKAGSLLSSKCFSIHTELCLTSAAYHLFEDMQM